MWLTHKCDVQSRGQSCGQSDAAAPDRIWRLTSIVVGASWIIVLYCFSTTVTAAVEVWQNSDTFSHGFLVVPLAIYLIWRQRDQITRLMPVPNYWGLPIFALLGIVWLIGHLASVMVIQQLALVAMLQLLVFTIAGWTVTRVLLFPLAFLIFTVPMGEELVRPLQDYTAFFTVKALQLTGIPVYRDGWVIVIPSGVWEVAEACAGVRYVIPSVILGCLFSYLVYTSLGQRVAFIAICFFGAIIANGMRAYGIVMLAHLTDNRIAVGVDHLIAGWIFFALVMLFLFSIGLRWRDREVTAVRDKAVRIHVASPRAVIVTAVIAVALLSFASVAAEWLVQLKPALAFPMISAPKVTLPWQLVSGYDPGWTPRFVGADTKLMLTYMSSDRPVHLFIAYYDGNQRQGAELIGGANALFQPKEWVPVSAGTTRTSVDGDFVSVQRSVVRSNNRARLVWSLYRVGGKYTGNPYFAKALEIKSILFQEQNSSALIALAVDVRNGDMREAVQTLQDFLRHVNLLEALETSR